MNLSLPLSLSSSFFFVFLSFMEKAKIRSNFYSLGTHRINNNHNFVVFSKCFPLIMSDMWGSIDTWCRLLYLSRYQFNVKGCGSWVNNIKEKPWRKVINLWMHQGTVTKKRRNNDDKCFWRLTHVNINESHC